MMEYILKGSGFLLRAAPRIFDDPGQPCNTLMEIQVQSGGFSGQATMELDAQALAEFAQALAKLYETLAGRAALAEPYGWQMYLAFTGDGRGHIEVKGQLAQDSGSGHVQRLNFENSVDQTCLKKFCLDLRRDWEQYTAINVPYKKGTAEKPREEPALPASQEDTSGNNPL